MVHNNLARLPRPLAPLTPFSPFGFGGDSLFDRLLPGVFNAPQENRQALRRERAGDDELILIPVPGYKPSDVDVSYDSSDRIVTVEAVQDETDENRRYVKNFTFSFYIDPSFDGTKDDAINAVVEDGLLTIRLNGFHDEAQAVSTRRSIPVLDKGTDKASLSEGASSDQGPSSTSIGNRSSSEGEKEEKKGKGEAPTS